MPSTWRTQRLCWSTARRTCSVYCSRCRSGGSWTTRSRRGAEIHSYFDTSRALHKSTPRSPQQQKSWRSDAPIILPGWECHTGGSRSKPTVHRCRQKTGGCGLLAKSHNNKPNAHKQHAQSQQMEYQLRKTSESLVAGSPKDSLRRSRGCDTKLRSTVGRRRWMR